MLQQLKARSILVIALFLASACSRLGTSDGDEGPPRSIVSTIAGNGTIGVAQGDAKKTGFVLPVGVSSAQDGSVLISDAGANAIYRLASGKIEWVAGKTTLTDGTEGASGGYVNGPVAVAQFYRPVAAVERNDGAILVADNLNHCIRIIQSGSVRTYAGSTDPGAADGNVSSAKFQAPTGLAFDADGNLLVSDFGVGIRRITKAGVVSTLPFGADSRDILGIAAATIENRQVIAYTEVKSVHLVIDGKEQVLAASQGRMPDLEGIPIFYGWGIAILNVNTVVVTDVMTSVIRLIRFPVLPFTANPASEAISGTLHEDTDFNGGYRDGRATEALYSGPRGICLDKRGRLIIADAGNRRIRQLSDFSFRETVLPDFSNYAPQPDAFNIVLIGQSYLFSGILWPDSIAGTLESDLVRNSSFSGLRQSVHVEAIRADGIGFAAMSSLANEFVVPRSGVNVVAFLLTPVTFAPVDDVVAEANTLARENISIAVAVLPLSTAVSIAERPYAACGCVPNVPLLQMSRSDVEAIQFAYQNAQVQTIPLLDEMLESERSPVHKALFNMYDNHLSVAGQRTVGHALADALLHDRPWNEVRVRTIPQENTSEEHSCPRAGVALGPNTIGHLDFVKAGPGGTPLNDGDRLRHGSPVLLEGWASDVSHVSQPKGLCVVVDGSSGYPAKGSQNQFRLDVVHAFGHPELASSGYLLTIKAGTLPRGHHSLGVGVVQADGVVLETPGAKEVEIR
jgi:hypothetical protein